MRKTDYLTEPFSLYSHYASSLKRKIWLEFRNQYILQKESPVKVCSFLSTKIGEIPEDHKISIDGRKKFKLLEVGEFPDPRTLAEFFRSGKPYAPDVAEHGKLARKTNRLFQVVHLFVWCCSPQKISQWKNENLLKESDLIQNFDESVDLFDPTEILPTKFKLFQVMSNAGWHKEELNEIIQNKDFCFTEVDTKLWRLEWVICLYKGRNLQSHTCIAISGSRWDRVKSIVEKYGSIPKGIFKPIDLELPLDSVAFKNKLFIATGNDFYIKSTNITPRFLEVFRVVMKQKSKLYQRPSTIILNIVNPFAINNYEVLQANDPFRMMSYNFKHLTIDVWHEGHRQHMYLARLTEDESKLCDKVCNSGVF